MCVFVVGWAVDMTSVAVGCPYAPVVALVRMLAVVEVDASSVGVCVVVGVGIVVVGGSGIVVACGDCGQEVAGAIHSRAGVVCNLPEDDTSSIDLDRQDLP